MSYYNHDCYDYDPEDGMSSGEIDARAERDSERQSRSKRNSCSDRMCGASDCWNCNPGGDEENENENEEE